MSNAEIVEETKRPKRLIDHILDLLDIKSHIDITKTVSGGVHIYL